MDTYGHDLARLRGAFVDFLHRCRSTAAPCCAPTTPACAPSCRRSAAAASHYGLGNAEGAGNDDLDRAVRRARRAWRPMHGFTATRRGAADLPVTLNLAGEHNVRNALAAIAVAQELGLPDAPVQRALAKFAGVGRRFQRHGELPRPRERALHPDRRLRPPPGGDGGGAGRRARCLPGRRLVLAFQPHRYTRTRDCFADFVAVLARFDAVLLTEVYAAGEAPIAGADGRALAAAVRKGNGPGGRCRFVADVQAPARGAGRRRATATSSSRWAPARSAACPRS
jgi:UDP-N-acetylmuramate--alanine ligase